MVEFGDEGRVRSGFLGREIESRDIPKPLSGAHVAKIVESIYAQVPPLLGVKFVESNVVLTLSGLKPWTYAALPLGSERPIGKYQNSIVGVNQYFLKSGLGISARVGDRLRTAYRRSGDISTLQFDLENLIGYERVSKTSKLPGVTAFEARSGFGGLGKWQHKTWESLKLAQAEGKIPLNYDLDDFRQGLMLGYPDQAILDFADWRANGKKTEIQEVPIPFTEVYQEAVPLFDLYPEHMNDLKIREYRTQAGTILRDFYNSAWHKRVSQDKVFLAAREE